MMEWDSALEGVRVVSAEEQAPKAQVIRVFLLDDHEIVRRGVRDLLEAEVDIEVVGEASTAEQALRRVP
ncbi:MAG: DNA-binding response regulator, partial [Actinomycetota bacterium]|nr:DNA-binding response regulator [Actinomycetota bacterium]